jgi:hypothetical protein
VEFRYASRASHSPEKIQIEHQLHAQAARLPFATARLLGMPLRAGAERTTGLHCPSPTCFAIHNAPPATPLLLVASRRPSNTGQSTSKVLTSLLNQSRSALSGCSACGLSARPICPSRSSCRCFDMDIMDIVQVGPPAAPSSRTLPPRLPHRSGRHAITTLCLPTRCQV